MPARRRRRRARTPSRRTARSRRCRSTVVRRIEQRGLARAGPAAAHVDRCRLHGWSNMTTVTPEPSAGVVGIADADAGDVGDEIAASSSMRLHDLSHPRSHQRHARHLALAPSRGAAHLGAHDIRRHLSRRADRRLVSFLSPCVLPLVPPYLVYLAGTSLERCADDEPEPRVRRETVLAALLFVSGFSTVFVALGASASVDRRADPRLFRPSSRSSPASSSSSWACTSSG